MPSLLKFILLVCALLSAASHAADNYPSKPLRIVVPWPPGGSADLRVRQIAEKLTGVIGQPVIVDNKAGASGQIGAESVARAIPDGYTILYGSVQDQGIAPAINPKLGYNPLQDFEHITLSHGNVHVLVVHPSVGVNSVKELTTLLRNNPGKYSYSSGGIAHTSHFTGALFSQLIQADTVHVAYKGSAPALADVVAGQVAFSFDFVGTSLPFIRSGKLKALLVTGGKRVPAVANVPTATEAGLKDLDPIVTWACFVAPKGTPKAIVARLNAAFCKVLRMKDLEKTFVESGTFTMPSTSDEFTAHLRRELPRWAALLERTKIEVE